MRTAIAFVALLTFAVVSLLFIISLPSWFTETEIQLFLSIPLLFAISAVAVAIKG